MADIGGVPGAGEAAIAGLPQNAGTFVNDGGPPSFIGNPDSYMILNCPGTLPASGYPVVRPSFLTSWRWC